MKFRSLIVTVALFFAGTIQGQEALPRVLPENFNADREQQMMRSYLRERCHEALDQRLAAFEKIDSPEAITTWQKERRRVMADALGEFPESGPLNPTVTGIIQEDGLRIEKVIFESTPGFHVTGNLYLPEVDDPCPVVLHVCGHSSTGKAADAYQLASRLVARQGIAVFCIDPIGQGERLQFPPNRPRLVSATREHIRLGAPEILFGRNLATWMIHDAMRAIDYLETRTELDTDKLGCMGNSGGGNLTSYLMAWEDRIGPAATGCFMTTHRRKNERPGPGDAEQNLFAQIRDGFDHPDFMLTRAPKPVLILSATEDSVPIEGAWEAFRQAKRVYSMLGQPEAVQLTEANDVHGFTTRLRESAARFFSLHLLGEHRVIFEEDLSLKLLKPEDLHCTPEGQVLKLPGARSLPELSEAYLKKLVGQRPPLTRELVSDVTGIHVPTSDPIAKWLDPADVIPRRVILNPEPGITMPGLYFPGKEGDSQAPLLISHGEGMASAGALVEEHKNGRAILLVDVRDIGETRTRNWRFPQAEAYIAQMLGTSLLAGRSEDLLSAARFLSAISGAEGIALLSVGETGSAALHAAFLAPEQITSIEIRNGLASWAEVLRARKSENRNMMPHTVHGGLRHYDLPALTKALGGSCVVLDTP